MPKIGEDLSVRAAGIHHVVGADDERDVGGGEFVVDVFELEDQVVGHAGLGQQHVHLARHAAGDRMDANLTETPAACSSLTNS
jgi:hypothetical protein